MALTKEKKQKIKNVIVNSLRDKFKHYIPETNSMPFHYRLLGKDRMALFSFIQSLNTTFGTSIYEPVAIELAKDRFNEASSQVTPYNLISSESQKVIQEILDDLIRAAKSPNKQDEIERIRRVCRQGDLKRVKLTKIDIWLKGTDNHIYMIDLKTAKPNVGNFQKYKHTLLEWIASELARNPTASVHSLIGIPYNPYEPKPYNRWTIRGMLDLDEELKVAEELWDFIGGKGAYEDILDCFEKAGLELRPEIDEYFSKFK